MRGFRERRRCWHCAGPFLAHYRDEVFCAAACGRAHRLAVQEKAVAERKAAKRTYWKRFRRKQAMQAARSLEEATRVRHVKLARALLSHLLASPDIVETYYADEKRARWAIQTLRRAS